MLLLLLPSSCYQQSSSAIILNVLSYGLIIDHGSLSARPHQQQPWWRPVSAAAATRSRPSERRKRESRAAKNGNTVFSDDFYIPALVGGCGARALKRVRLLITFAPPNYTAPRRAV